MLEHNPYFYLLVLKFCNRPYTVGCMIIREGTNRVRAIAEF